jgi:hypothetical protein
MHTSNEHPKQTDWKHLLHDFVQCWRVVESIRQDINSDVVDRLRLHCVNRMSEIANRIEAEMSK